jgi:prepilin-type processing-associated H-X9-DG protein
VESAAAITVVALILGVAMPVGSANKVEQQKQACLLNMRGLARMAAAYALDDPRSILGPVHPEALLFACGTGYAEYGGGPGTSPHQGWGESFDPQTRPFNHMVYGRDGLSENTVPGDRTVFREFQCTGNDLGWQAWPGLGTLATELEAPYFRANGTSFRMNNLPIRFDELGGIFGRPVDAIPAPSATIAFMEARAFQSLHTNDVLGPLEPGELTSYHSKLGFFNVVYCDGHAAFADFGNGTFFEQNPRYEGRDARGTWGRMDCLPAPVLLRTLRTSESRGGVASEAVQHPSKGGTTRGYPISHQRIDD